MSWFYNQRHCQLVIFCSSKCQMHCKQGRSKPDASEKKECMLSSDVEDRWALFILHRVIHEPIVVIRTNFLWGIMMNRISVGTGAPINRAPAISRCFSLNYLLETCMHYQDKHSKISACFNFLSVNFVGVLSLYPSHPLNCLIDTWMIELAVSKHLKEINIYTAISAKNYEVLYVFGGIGKNLSPDRMSFVETQ